MANSLKHLLPLGCALVETAGVEMPRNLKLLSRRFFGLVLGGLVIPLFAHASSGLSAQLAEWAENHGIRMFHCDPIGLAGPQSGDYVVYQIRATTGEQKSEWLVILRRESGVLARASAEFSQTRYLSSGRRIDYMSRNERIGVSVVNASVNSGRSAANISVRHATVEAPFDYLHSGFVETAKAHLAVERQRIAGAQFDPTALLCLNEPPAPKLRRQAIEAWKATGLSEAEQAAWARGFVSFVSFFELIARVPELDTIMRKVVATPAGTDLLSRAIGRVPLHVEVGGPSVRQVRPAALGLMPVESSTFSLPYALFLGRSKLVVGQLIVTGSDVPLDLCGGVLRILAVHPNDATVSLDAQLITIVSAQ